MGRLDGLCEIFDFCGLIFGIIYWLFLIYLWGLVDLFYCIDLRWMIFRPELVWYDDINFSRFDNRSIYIRVSFELYWYGRQKRSGMVLGVGLLFLLELSYIWIDWCILHRKNFSIYIRDCFGYVRLDLFLGMIFMDWWLVLIGILGYFSKSLSNKKWVNF